MASLDRSAALRRLGITEWLPRHHDAAISAAFDAEPALAPAPSVPALVRAENEVVVVAASSAIAPSADVRAVNADAVAKATSVATVRTADQPSLSAPTNPAPATASTAAMSLRGRLLRPAANAPLLVLAMAEKSPRDTLLNVDSAAGTLLQAMLAELAVPNAIALLGVGGGEPIAVPDTVLVLGERSARLLLGNDVAMPLRGRVHLFGNARVVVTYHPDELRQNGSLKRLAWDDLRLVAGLLATANASGTAAAMTSVGNGSR